MKNSGSENMVDVGLYKRTATLGDASSLIDQERVCVEFLDQRYGPGRYHVKMYTDEGFSGSQGFVVSARCEKNARPGLSALAAAVARGEIQAVIVHRMDRIARSFAVCVDFLSNVVEKHRAEIICVAERQVIRNAREYLKGVTRIEDSSTRK